jgi:hypothetical protein
MVEQPWQQPQLDEQEGAPDDLVEDAVIILLNSLPADLLTDGRQYCFLDHQHEKIKLYVGLDKKEF